MEQTLPEKSMTVRYKNLLVDSGFFFALFDPRDSYHDQAETKKDCLDVYSLVVPWPVLYETMNTRFARRPATIARFHRVVRKPDTLLLEDAPYRQNAYNDTLELAGMQNGSKSLVDLVLCAIIKDPNVRIDAMLTFDRQHFEKTCRLNGVEFL